MQLKSMITGGAILLTAAGTASANTYSWNWTAGSGLSPNNAAGEFNWVNASFNSVTNELSWTFNVDRSGSYMTDAFTLALNGGPNPKGHDELALLYFDGSGGASNSPIMTVYGYNGRNNFSSYYDGSATSGIQSPDLIASSLNSSNWILDRFLTDNIDGSRTMGFSIDVSDINSFDPFNDPVLQDGEDVEWGGMQFGEKIGLWFHTFAGTTARYGEDGFLDRNPIESGRGYNPGSWRAKQHGWIDASNQPTSTEPVPEPTTIALMGTGLAGLVGRMRRRKQQPTVDA